MVGWLYCPEMRTHSKTLGLYILWELLFANIWAGMKLASCLVTLSSRGSEWKQFVKFMGLWVGRPIIPAPQFHNQPNDRNFSLKCRCPSSEHSMASRLIELLLFSAQGASIFFASQRHCYTRLGVTILIELRYQNQTTFF